MQKTFTVGRYRIDGVLDAYNLLDSEWDVEERSAQLPDVREATAVQPPRAFLLGARLRF